MSTANQKIMSRLGKIEENARKALSIPFKPQNIEKLDAIPKAMTKHFGNTTTRNTAKVCSSRFYGISER